MSDNNLEIGSDTNKFFYANPINNDVEVRDTKDGNGNFVNIAGKAPTEPRHFVTKDYLDSALGGVTANILCQAATTTNLDGFDTGLEGGDDLDGVLLVVGDKILIKNEIDQTQNGVYIVSQNGAPCRIRACDLAYGKIVSVENGNTNGGTYWVSDGSYTGDDNTPVYDIDNIAFGSTNIYPNALAGPKIYVFSDTNPVSDNDTTEGYKDGDIWIDSDSETGYICIDSSEGDAIWTAINNSAVGDFGAIQWSDGYGNLEADNNFVYSPDNGELQIPFSINDLYGNLIKQRDDGSIAIGNTAYADNTGYLQNTVIGWQAFNNSGGGGENNVIVGYVAAENNDSGSFNVVIGSEAGWNMQSASNIVAIGYQAYSAFSSGENNIAIGSYTMSDSGGEGTDNVAIGYQAMEELNDGLRNIGIGTSALFNNGTNNDNIAIGFNGLTNLSSSGNNQNIAIGSYSLSNVENTTNCIAIGFESMANSTSIIGSDNIGIGYQTLINIAAGSDNIAMGGYALLTNQTGNSNIGIGYTALNTFDGGDNNVAIGIASLYTLSGSSDNTAIGNFSSANQTGGGQNLFAGCYAGNGFLSGDNNVLLGYNAAPSLTSGENNIVIGSGCDVLDATNNQINIGNVFMADTNGNVSIPGNIIIPGQIWTGDNAGTGGTAGTIIDKLPIYNSGGTLIGYIPIYDGIS